MLALSLLCPVCGTAYRPGCAVCSCGRVLESVEPVDVSEAGLPPLMPVGPPPPPPPLVLVEAEGRPFLHLGRRVTSARLGARVLQIGRADPLGGFHPEIDVTGLPGGERVSRRHAEICVEDGEVVLVDVGSQGGTRTSSPDRVLTANEPVRLGRHSGFLLADKLTFLLTEREGV